MNKIQYMMYCVRNMDFTNMRNVVRDVAAVSRRPRAVIAGDMLWCALRYQAGYHDYQEFDFWHLSRAQRRTFNTRGINNSIVRRSNDKQMMESIQDKGNFYAAYSEFLHRDWLDLRKCSQADFEDFARRHPVFIAKPPMGYGGKGIEKVTVSEPAEDVYRSLMEKELFVLDEIIEQHPDLAVLYPHSVNTMRMFTYFDGSEGHLLQSVLKMGNDGKFMDNFSSGGMYSFLDKNGKVLFPAVDVQDHVFESHPMTGQPIVGFQVPLFREAEALVCQAAAVTPSLRYIGWDVAIAKDGPLIIEGNEFPGVFEPKGRFLRPDQRGSLVEYRKYMKV